MPASIVQSSTRVGFAGASTLNLSLTGVAAGNSIIVTCAAFNDSGAPTISATDGTAYSVRQGTQGAGNPSATAAILWLHNVSSGNKTITVTTTSGSTGRYGWARAMEVSGLVNAAPNVTMPAASGANGATSSTPSTGSSGATTAANCFVVAVLTVSGGGTNAGIDTPATTGYTNHWVDQDFNTEEAGAADYKSVTSTGAQSAAWGTLTGSYLWAAALAAFEETSTGVSITAGLGALTLTGLVPTVSATGGGSVSVSSGLGQAVITGLAPTVAATGNQFATSGLGQAVITGLAPTVVATDNIRIAAALGQAVITGFAPSQTLTLSSPPAGALVLSGHAPTVQVSAPGAITTGLGALVFTGFAPSVNAADSASITAGVGSLVATGLAPTVSATANVSITAALGQAVITGLAPNLAATDNQFAAPDVGQAVITGHAPTLSQAGSFSATPGVGILELLGLSPSVVNSGDVTTTRRHAGYIWPRRRNYIYKGKRYHNLTPDELMRLIAADEADITREDIKVSYKNKKPHIIAKDAWADLQTALQSLSKLEPIEYDDDEDIEAIIALL